MLSAADLITELEALGYTDETYNEIDADIAGHIRCPQCLGQCQYVGRVNPVTTGYRSFARCVSCGHLEEFG